MPSPPPPPNAPPSTRALLDPDTPLARPERLVPGGLIAPTEAFVTLLLCGAFGLGLGAAALYAWARYGDAGEVDEAGLYVAPALVIGAVALGVRAWWRLTAARGQRDRLGAGRWRRGLFVEDDGLLIVDATSARWVERGSIESIELDGGQAWVVTNNERVPLDGPPVALTERLRVWRRTGRFGWAERV